MYNIFKGCGVEVDILSPDNFLKIKETLSRIGVKSSDSNTLYQSCHILHKSHNNTSRYAIVHFKEMFTLDGKETNITAEDIRRRDSIALLLDKWGLLKIIQPDKLNSTTSTFTVVPYKDKPNWKFIQKYNVGRNKNV